MKKRLLALILSALLLTTATACNTVSAPENGDGTIEDTQTETESERDPTESNTEEQTDDNQTNITTSEIDTSESDDSNDTKESKALKKYKEALYDLINRMVPTETIGWYLGGDQYLEYLSFAIVDMNEDGFSELIVRNIDSLDEEHAVLHYVSGYEHLVSSSFGFRSMYYLMKDGTFSWTRSAGYEYGISKLKIDGFLREVIELYTIKNDGTDDVEFFIYDQKVTEEEFDAFAAQFSNERAEFYKLTEENIEKYVTMEFLTHE